jgi:enoyl-CoA hydratase/carnithine racemase
VARMTAGHQLCVEVTDGIATVTLSNPGRANALSNQTFRHDLPALLEELGSNPGLRALVITGDDGAFCAGSELDADGFGGEVTHQDTVELLRDSHRSVESLRSLSVPSIAAIDGVAIGAGLGLAAACDLRVCSSRARFGAPYVRMGLTPDMGLSALLPELIGTAAALELTLTGRLIGAENAVGLGLVSRIVEDPLADALELARAIAANPPMAVSATRRLVRAGTLGEVSESLFEAEPRAFADALHGEEFEKQFAAYRAGLKRKGGDRG